ncbi:tRNA (adenosine(37)-N6)-threonylcarbamoyltransferase complex dimerization subunit type 1 TsaB [Novosphingobium ginsenosidimutans]|uniref:tRNA (Adenosine(37)-N6)-threonylcarbamoyltransferase complex dimerization subunit type 1 TsaB n=1 Tax=Novosphingobium ginsenosidimutans TaxID=1176536 RepID=A0A5B8S1M5_9SPHN|nr:tRNA (adenosine(37)-N6)-threonylcarbamoyltransferase complex dimerization subunit type 1 TsaB [Novosphingobium ginsenosidimutans]QEA15024.1 tRNA (adenosine(37)-N6)-threonylcarbamoyltransferase complex dimerization subunit type 1 TsaB [Novosphingobium ginsenosidimutans]
MKTLVIDSATEACSVALLQGYDVLAGDYRLLGRGHAEALVPMIGALPDKGRADRIAVALGPGSFTGVRVGLAAARALALAWHCELVGYPSLALVAAMAQDQAGTQPCTVAMTGGHGEWFVQSFAADGLPLGELASLNPDAAAASSSIDLVAGTQAEALVTRRGSGQALPLHPDARSFGLLPAVLIGPADQPLYGRAPDARLPAA